MRLAHRANSALLPLLAGALLLAGCAGTPVSQPGAVITLPPVSQPEPKDSAPLEPIDVSAIPDAVPQPEPVSKYGNPERYEVLGETYSTLKSSKEHVERGSASWYGTKFHGRRTSSGEPYNMYEMTAAHKTLPLPTYAQVTNLDNGRSVVVKINDRGPFHKGRILDLSYAAAMKLGIVKSGTARIELRTIDPLAPQAHLAPAANAAPEAVTVATAPATTQGLFLQVGAFSTFSNAESLRNRLSNIATSPIVISKSTQPQPLYRVRIGPLANDQEAQQLAQRLAQIGLTQTSVVVD
jgi:rare lipoprotein A